MNMVELRQVSKQYGDVTALSTVDLNIEEGEFVTLLGPSGSGKTTLLNLIAGMIKPTAGKILIKGEDVTDRPPSERKLGMVFQNYALMPHMTIFENIAFPLRVRRLSKEEIEQRVHDVLKLVKLPNIADRKPKELSGGQQQRVSLARCIVYNPALILLDEPLGALDKKLREQMQLEIRRIHADLGITMLNVTHDQDEALTMSDRIVLMNEGRIEQIAPPEQLYFRPNTVFAADFIGTANLIEATVISMDERSVSVSTRFGNLNSSYPEQRPTAGAEVTLLIRPESVRFMDADSGPQPGEQSLAGTLSDSIVMGSVVKHHIELGESQQIILLEPNRQNRSVIPRGAPVNIGWSIEDSLTLI